MSNHIVSRPSNQLPSRNGGKVDTAPTRDLFAHAGNGHRGDLFPVEWSARASSCRRPNYRGAADEPRRRQRQDDGDD